MRDHNAGRTYSHLQRLAASGYVARVAGGESGAVVMTRDGWRRLGRAVNDVPRGMTYGLGLRHACAVSWVAALLSLRERTWIAERQMRRQQVWQVPVLWTGSRGTHRPDLGMERDGRRMAIEVELSPKAPRRLRATSPALSTRSLPAASRESCTSSTDRKSNARSLVPHARWVCRPERSRPDL
jgi:hypothetical protein